MKDFQKPEIENVNKLIVKSGVSDEVLFGLDTKDQVSNQSYFINLSPENVH